MKRVAVFAAITLIGAHAQAQSADDQFAVPDACTLDLTVQMHSCQVANLYHCAGDAEGDRWISYADGDGEYFLSLIDSETRWLQSISLDNGEIAQLDEAGSKDNASFSTLLDTGEDDYDFVTYNNFGETRRQIGRDWLTGDKVTIDGKVLERADFKLETQDKAGNILARRSGTQYIDRDLRVFFSGRETYESPQGDSVQTYDAPVSFAHEGEDGFGAAKPIYDCDMTMTALRPEDLR
ncbi:MULTISPECIES: hypothetical protein [Thioclava]|uniref:Uncharacterized protein n=1 Tax=Thioclava litoralis TaxID=3076557 RepID=A0ABZ1E497_9RHOB|nr:hypothetical protein RPE78_05795 [Thioclava sp. FTW29]